MEPIDSTKSADATWRMVQEAAGPGYFIVGDAAAVLDPASSHGVLKAMMSGIMAAHLIVKFIESGVEQVSQVEPTLRATQSSKATHIETRCLETYRQWLENWFLHDANRLRELYSQFHSASSWLGS